jgi:HEXXH motif-containing protein
VSARETTSSPSGTIVGQLPQTLRWVTDGTEFEDVELRHAQRISDALGPVLARLSPELADTLATRLSQASEDAIQRVLLSPNISQGVLWGRGPADELGRLLERTLRLEAGTGESDGDGAPPRWGALGDCVLYGTGDVDRWNPVGGRLALDLRSPDVIAVGSTPPPEAVAWTPLEPAEERDAVATLTRAYAGIRDAGPSLKALIETCARVVVVRKSATEAFVSFSSCHYVGRIALVNPQLVSEWLIADALVHEAVHSYLYMHDPNPLWGLDADVREEPGMVRSPWTGRALPVCAFLHACFVWYALLFFWGQVLRSSQPLADDVRRRIELASRGFLRGDLLECVGPNRIELLQHDVRVAVAEMQDNVLAAVA